MVHFVGAGSGAVDLITVRGASSTARQAAICIAVGKVSFEDCDILTSSFG